MGVRNEQIFERKRDPVTHHLALSSLATIDENGLAFANDSE